MPELSPLQISGFGAVAAVVVSWLAVSFLKPGPARTSLAWVGTLGLYVALLSLFVSLFLRSQASGSLAGQIGFGFLVVMFGSGALVSVVRTLAALRSGRSSSDAHATH